MTTGEEPGESINKVEARTVEIARQVGDAAAYHAGEFLKEYVGVGKPISQEGYEAILAAERERAETKYRAHREAGLANEEISQAPGLTALLRLRPDSGGRDKRVFDLIPDQPAFSSPSIEQISEVDENTGLFALRLPEGVYHSDNFMHFLTKGNVWAGKIRGEREDSFALFDFQVVRIEGDNGELWQNPGYTPDGTKRETQEAIS
jgi:hypothetical protein